MKRRAFLLISLISIIASIVASCQLSTLIPKATPPPLIPYGTYKYRIYSQTWAYITLNSNKTFESLGISMYPSDLAITKSVGTYTIADNYLTLNNDSTNASIHIQYRYSTQFKCLYLYADNEPFYAK